jgi:hypothetical protein
MSLTRTIPEWSSSSTTNRVDALHAHNKTKFDAKIAAMKDAHPVVVIISHELFKTLFEWIDHPTELSRKFLRNRQIFAEWIAENELENNYIRWSRDAEIDDEPDPTWDGAMRGLKAAMPHRWQDISARPRRVRMIRFKTEEQAILFKLRFSDHFST